MEMPRKSPPTVEAEEAVGKGCIEGWESEGGSDKESVVGDEANKQCHGVVVVVVVVVL